MRSSTKLGLQSALLGRGCRSMFKACGDPHVLTWQVCKLELPINLSGNLLKIRGSTKLVLQQVPSKINQPYFSCRILMFFFMYVVVWESLQGLTCRKESPSIVYSLRLRKKLELTSVTYGTLIDDPSGSRDNLYNLAEKWHSPSRWPDSALESPGYLFNPSMAKMTLTSSLSDRGSDLATKCAITVI